jgi:3-oxoadipate enol-lactonase
VNSVALHHNISGPAGAPTVLLGGSLGTTGAMWDPQVAALSPHLRTVAFDHRGHGGSPVPEGPYEIAQMGGDVLALIDTLELDRISYVGLSIGGMVGQWLAANHPERIDRLVLMTTTAHMSLPDAYAERAATVREAGTTEVVADAVLSRWFTPHWIPSHLETVAELREMICGTPVEGYAGCCEAIATMDLRGALPSIAAPTLVIGGADDPAVPPDHQRAIAAAVTGAQLEIIEDAAHLPNIQHPDRVNRLIASHLGVNL